ELRIEPKLLVAENPRELYKWSIPDRRKYSCVHFNIFLGVFGGASDTTVVYQRAVSLPTAQPSLRRRCNSTGHIPDTTVRSGPVGHCNRCRTSLDIDIEKILSSI